MSAPSNHSIRKPVVVITGGASGIGLALSQHFASLDHVVVVLDIDQRSAADIIAQVKGEHLAATVDFFKCSVSEWDDLVKAFREIYDRFRSIDIVMANAGIAEIVPSEMSQVTEEPTKPDLKVMDVNMTGVIYTVRLASYYMSKNIAIGNAPRGSIICTASMAGLYSFPLSPLYSTSKFGVIGLIRSMGIVLAKHNVQINALAPAVLDTNIIPNKAVFNNMRVTPVATLIRGVMDFLENPGLTGEVAEIHGDQVTIRPGHEIIDEYEKKNLAEFWSLA